ncbi:MAG: hypothetical protein ACT4QG_09590 [Sporichthyaceae bacterium]
MDQHEPVDLTGPRPEPVRPGKRNAWQIGLIAGATALTVVAAGGAWAVGSFLSGGGAQPDDVLRSGALAFAKLDMDPAASQKLAVWQLSKKFPAAFGDAAEKTVVQELLGEAILEDVPTMTYERDVKPWVGDRLAVAVYPGATATAEPIAAVAVAYTNEAAMKAALEKADAVQELSWATRDGFVVVASEEEGADRLLASDTVQPLRTQANYRADMDAIGGAQLLTGWVDLGEVGKAIAAAATQELSGEPEAAALTDVMNKQLPSGRLAFGLHADSQHLELVGKTFGVENAKGTAMKPGTNLAGTMPENSVGALSIAGIASNFAELEDQLSALDGFGSDFDAISGMFGIDLSKDLAAIFGDETALSVSADADKKLDVTVRTLGGDADRVRGLLAMLTRAGVPIDAALRPVAGGFVFGTDSAVVHTVSQNGRSLASTESFKRAVPDAEGAALVGYLSFPRLAQVGGLTAAEAKDAEKLDALGITIGAEENPTFRIRLTTR